MTIVITVIAVLVVIIGAGALLTITKAGSKENICKYDYNDQEETDND